MHKKSFLSKFDPRGFGLILIILSACVCLLPAVAQAGPKILVLTSHEGFGDEKSNTYLREDGRLVSNGLASAFGNVDSDQVTFPKRTLTPKPDEVTYLYGALSIRKLKKTGNAATDDKVIKSPTSKYPATEPTAKKVRVINSNVAGTQDDVLYVTDNTPMLDPNDQASLTALFTPKTGGRYDLVIVGSAYFKVTDEAYVALAKVMQDPELKPSAILYFIDSCCDVDTKYYYSRNVARYMAKVLKPATYDPTQATDAGVNRLIISPSVYGGDYRDFPVNSNPPNTSAVGNSLYAQRFATLLPKITGGYYQSMLYVPDNNILYQPYSQDVATYKVGNVTTKYPGQAYGAFFPSTQIFQGFGTCTFSVIDITATSSVNYDKVANRALGQTFLQSALAGGACGGMASINASPTTSAVSLAQPAASITLTVKNESTSNVSADKGIITGGRVASPLPAHLKFSATTNASSTCKDSKGVEIAPTITRATTANTTDTFSLADITIGYQGSCTITLPVEWTDTSDPATNACIQSSNNKSTLSIVPGVPNQFSTTQGQTNDIATANVVCTAPELALSIPTLPNASYSVGDTVSYDVTVQSLSQTAAANGIVFSGLAPAGVAPANITVVPKAGQTNPVACTSASNCSLTTSDLVGSSATFTVSFPAPVTAGSASMTWTPTVALTPGNQEVTLTNNAQSLGANLNTYPLNVNAQLTSSGTITNYASQYAGTAQAVSVNGCTIASQSGAVQLGAAQNTTGTAFQLQILANSGTCAVSFPNSASSPDPLLLPPGFVMQPVVVSGPAPDANNVPTFTGTWTALPPAAGSVLGSVTGAPTPFPANLVGQTVGYSLTCAPHVALPATGTLTVGANGALTAAAQPQIPSGSSCTIALTSDPSTLPLPKFYKWDTPVLSTATTSPFTVTLKMAPMPTQLSVQAQLNVPGSGDFSTLSGNPIAFTVANCSAATTSGSAPLGIGKPGAAQILSTKAGEECEVSFTGSPNTDALPPGYILQAAMANAKAAKTSAATKAAAAPTLVLTSTMDPVTGNQTVIATWTVLPPGAASVTGSVTGAPSTFPSNLVGQTVSFALTCTPGAATPANGTLTIDASGQLTTSVQPQVPSGSTCSLALSSDPGALPLPSGYQWGAPVIAGSGNSFTVTLPMSSKGVVSATPVPTLAQWALYLLGMLMLVAAARQLRTRR